MAAKPKTIKTPPLSEEEVAQYHELKDICVKIYNARNIPLSNDSMLEQLKRIDRMFRDENYN